MKLKTKFNLVLSSVFIVGLMVVGFISHTVLQNNAKEEVIKHAGMMMEAALAIRGYTVKEIQPLLASQLKQMFLPQSVPSYAATQNFNALRKNNPEYHYKEATLNPTNPRDQATDWETDIIQEFRDNQERTTVIGERDTPTGRVLYYAMPIKIKNKACLTCHSTANAAPATMIKLYGDANGFGWKHNEVVGSQIVSVPLYVPIEKANHAFIIIMGSLILVSLIMFILLNIMLNKIIIKPVRTISHIADEISNGNSSVDQFEHKGDDEISELSESFNRMRISLEKAMKMLGED
jgi:protein-histidine pros-kinase